MEKFNLIAHATVDEDGNIYGGDDGEQCGFELNLTTWYSRPWVSVYRPVNDTVADKIATFMVNAVSNGYIGYSSNRRVRHAYVEECRKHNFDVSKIDTLQSCDCSSLVYSALLTCFDLPFEWYDDANAVTIHEPLVRHIPSMLDGTNAFEKFTSSSYINGDSLLQRGDILIADGHVAVWV